MLIKITYFSTLLLYAAIISQSVFYWLAMARVTKSLRVESYIESRQLIDRNLKRNLSQIYYATAFSCILLIAFSITNPTGLLFATSIIAFLALLSDMLLAVRYNIPLNQQINSWSASNYPDNWQQYRDRWLSAYRIRQIVNLIGFLALAAGFSFGH